MSAWVSTCALTILFAVAHEGMPSIRFVVDNIRSDLIVVLSEK